MSQKKRARRSAIFASALLWALVPNPGSSVLARAASAPATVIGFRGVGRDGVFPGTLPRRRPGVAWSFQTEGPVHGSPIWVDGLVVAGSGDGHLYAIDAATGAERWRFATRGAVDGPAAYVRGQLVVESRDVFLKKRYGGRRRPVRPSASTQCSTTLSGTFMNRMATARALVRRI